MKFYISVQGNRSHALAPVRTLSMEKIAALGGYDSYAVANVQYGKLAGMIIDELGISGLAQNVQVICELAAGNDGSCMACRMVDVQAAAKLC